MRKQKKINLWKEQILRSHVLIKIAWDEYETRKLWILLSLDYITFRLEKKYNMG